MLVVDRVLVRPGLLVTPSVVVTPSVLVMHRMLVRDLRPVRVVIVLLGPHCCPTHLEGPKEGYPSP
jgi:hypothetical protein